MSVTKPASGSWPTYPDDVGEVARPVVAGVPAVDDHPAVQGAAGEVRDQPVQGAQQRGLAGPGPADHEDQLALGDAQVHARRAPARRRRRTSRRPGAARSRRHLHPVGRPAVADGAGPLGDAASGSGGARKAGSAPTRMPATVSSGTGGRSVTLAR